MKPHLLNFCLLDLEKNLIVADLFLKGVCLSSILLHCSVVQ